MLGTKISEGMLSGPAQARGGLPPALSQLAIVPASCLRATAYPAVVPALLWESEFVCVSSKKTSNIVILIIYFLRMKCISFPTQSNEGACCGRRSKETKTGELPVSGSLRKPSTSAEVRTMSFLLTPQAKQETPTETQKSCSRNQ
ncbi:hypothetical protein CSV73_11970 [Sporosarcina sp. P1]|nr:hypothetical protein CSV73_11970 [Sporosarcina sp. P1]